MSSSSSSTGTGPAGSDSTAPWWQRLVGLLREQWIAASLLAMVLVGDTVALASAPHSVQMAVGAALMAALAIFAQRYPVHCGLAAAVVLCADTAVALGTKAYLHSGGLWKILPTENLAGLLLVVYLFRFRPLRKAISVAALLVAACVGSTVLRIDAIDSSPLRPISMTLALGFLQLLLAAGTGLYLGWRRSTRVDVQARPLLELLGRQWPAMAALILLLFLDFAQVMNTNAALSAGVVVLLCGVVMSVLAVVGPARPVQAAALGASALVMAASVIRFMHAEIDATILGPIPITATGAGMLLLSYTTRYAAPRKAVWTGAALVGSALFALFVIPLEDAGDDYVNELATGGFLLVVSVGTGMYFRARDRDRESSVRNAVTDAQNAERMALARELHDVVAHHVTGIVVQAQAAQMVAAKNPAAATDALANIADSGTEALTAMRRLVASMRGAEPAGASEATEQATSDLEADLRALVESARQRPDGRAGVPTMDLRVDLGRQIPPEVARSALRVVQESLTNAQKHALDVNYIQIDVYADLDNLHARVTDNGTGVRGQPLGGSGGYGLVGMRERIELLGGRFQAGPGEHVGWRVEAKLPLAAKEEVGHR